MDGAEWIAKPVLAAVALLVWWWFKRKDEVTPCR